MPPRAYRRRKIAGRSRLRKRKRGVGLRRKPRSYLSTVRSKAKRPAFRKKAFARRLRRKVRIPRATAWSALKGIAGDLKQPYEFETINAVGSLVNCGQWCNTYGKSALNAGYTIKGSAEGDNLPFAGINDPYVLMGIWANCISLIGDSYRFVTYNQVARTTINNMSSGNVTISAYAFRSRRDCGTRALGVATTTPTVPGEPGICTLMANGAQQDTENDSHWLSYMNLAVPRPYDVRRVVKHYKLRFVGKRTLQPGKMWQLSMRSHKPVLHDARDWFATSQSTGGNYTVSMIQNTAATRFPPRMGFLFHVVGELALGATSGVGYSHSLIYVHTHYSCMYAPFLASQPYLRPTNVSNIVGNEKVFTLNTPTATAVTDIA